MRLSLSKVLLCLVLFILNVGATPLFENCIKHGQIRFFYKSEMKVEQSDYCTNHDKTNLISTNCSTENCFSKTPKLKLNRSDLYSEFGKPGFELCRMLHGKPQIIEFVVNQKWFKLDRCLFNDGTWYMDTDFLIDNYFIK